MDNKKKGSRVTAFLKRNVYYLVMIVCIAAIGTMITVAVINSGKPPVDNSVVPTPTTPDEPHVDVPAPVQPEIPAVVTPIVFAMPVANATVVRDYVMDGVIYFPTLKQYQSHAGINYGASEGTIVTAAFGGVVQSVEYDILNGHVITVNHGDGLVSIYGSLNEVNVSVGQPVTKGQRLGTVGTTATACLSDGNHCFFAVKLNGKYVSPVVYLEEGSK